MSENINNEIIYESILNDYEINYEYGIFRRKDNHKCQIKFKFDKLNKVEITMFECYKRETINSTGITHSSGDGRNMLMNLLINLKQIYPQIIIIYLTADAFIHKNSNK